MVKNAVLMYVEITGKLPPSRDGLRALVQRPKELSDQTPWKMIADKVPVDAWGREYRIVFGDSYPDGFGIFSFGRDGLSHTQGNDPDDWNSWSADSRGVHAEDEEHFPRDAAIGLGACLVGFFLGTIVARLQKKTEQSADGKTPEASQPPH